MNKIQALEQTIYNLKNDLVEYNWIDTNHCNCGVLAKTVLQGKTPEECGLYNSTERAEGVGPFASYAQCMTSDLPMPLVFQSLKDAGFSFGELKELEDLSNYKICQRAGMWNVYDKDGRKINLFRERKEYLILYLKTWVEILKEETVAPEPVHAKERIKYISVPESLTAQAKEVILTSEITS